MIQGLLLGSAYVGSLGLMAWFGIRQSRGERSGDAVSMALAVGFPIALDSVFRVSSNVRYVLVAGLLINVSVLLVTGLKPLKVFYVPAVGPGKRQMAPLKDRLPALVVALTTTGAWLIFAPQSWGGFIGGL
jgi:uncharacterized sodium:solute symporter family permease YidK